MCMTNPFKSCSVSPSACIPRISTLKISEAPWRLLEIIIYYGLIKSPEKDLIRAFLIKVHAKNAPH